MKRAEEIGFTLLLVMVFAVFVILGWGYAKRPRIVPLTLSIPGLALSLLHLGATIIKTKKAKKEQQADASEKPKSIKKAGDAHKPFLSSQPRKILEIWAWIIALALGINFLGFMIAIPVFLLAFIKFFAERTWKLSVLISASFTLAVYLVFYVGLKTTL